MLVELVVAMTSHSRVLIGLVGVVTSLTSAGRTGNCCRRYDVTLTSAGRFDRRYDVTLTSAGRTGRRCGRCSDGGSL